MYQCIKQVSLKKEGETSNEFGHLMANASAVHKFQCFIVGTLGMRLVHLAQNGRS